MPSVRWDASMDDPRTFKVKLVRVGPGLPYIEVGAYEYVAELLPGPGETITVNRVVGGGGDARVEVRGYVTRVDPTAEMPISVTEVDSGAPGSDDDFL
jgi:hypothetical protein